MSKMSAIGLESMEDGELEAYRLLLDETEV